jgi:hypothetical protein
MPRYFFDLADHETAHDETGTELANADAARTEAVLFAGAYLRDHPGLVWDRKDIRVIVRNQDNQTIFTVIALSVDCL